MDEGTDEGMNVLAMRGSKMHCATSESRKSWVSIEEPSRTGDMNKDPFTYYTWSD